MKQSTALAILKTGQNVFLTGQAGAGKTYVLNQYIDYLRVRGVPVAITASTGIAATHMNGMTIHSWSGIGIADSFEKVNLQRLAGREDYLDRIRNTKVLIVDEISMLHLKQVDAIDAVMRHFRKSELPFGGVQVIFSGDFFQLPPVGEKGETSKEKYAFMSKAWLECNFQICYLTEQHRQAGQGEREKYGLSLNDILNQIRSQTVTQQAVDVLSGTQMHTVAMNRTRLYTHNTDVDKINQKELDQLDATPQSFVAVSTGEKALRETLLKSVRAPETLTLKIGAKVMFVKNMPLLGVYNGTMGEIKAFMGVSGKQYKDAKAVIDEVAYPIVQLNNGGEVLAEPEEWTTEGRDGEVLASVTQVPLCLAWAITVHKSQGMTLDAAEIDLSKTFEMGQGYVALSRLRSLDGLKLLGLKINSLLLDEWVQFIDRRLIELSQEHAQAFGVLDDDALEQIYTAFIDACGGITDPAKIALNEKHLAAKKQAAAQRKAKATQHKKDAVQSNGLTATVNATYGLIQTGMTLENIAAERSLALSTVIGHLDDVIKAGKEIDRAKYQPDADVLADIQAVYERLDAQGEFVDGVKLRPIVEELDSKYNYNQVRLALIFIDTKADQGADKAGDDA
ncbi:AAA family ATPase [Moraxella sp. FZFQ2102]|uniref:helix-turn-helix domain-containing protein n=1 Tax=Moraxella sp. FZFQ2102 TaxID=2953752 RepID=UPI00209C6375|nr:helix-turn-helix domain-containing protein [Moraxella sp. FZFQ2102]USZ14424.1 AAA family ATPase [Moraxella sp. FZFQ2102]